MRTNRLLILAVLLSLIINFVLLGRIGELNNQMQSLQQNLNNMRASLQSISSNVSTTLAQFTKEQSWITSAQLNNEKTTVENGKGQAVLNWQVKDFQDGSDVLFHYNFAETGDFTSVPAQSLGNGLFEVTIPMGIKVEPFWDIQVSKTSGNRSTSQTAESKQANFVRYYVSVKAKDTVRSSEIAYLDLNYLSKVKYGPITAHVDINNTKYNVDIVAHDPAVSGYESVMAKFYSGSTLVAEKALEAQQRPDNSPKVYHITYDAGAQKISHAVIQVKYTNGTAFEKQIDLGL